MLENFHKITTYVNWLYKGKPVPPPNIIKERMIKKYAHKFPSNVFIETGTYYGDRVHAVKNMFPRIISIELDKKLYIKAKRRFKNDSNIEIIQGDSAEVLLKILPGINESILFWLDAHYSGGVTAKGKTDTPILDELKVIFVNHPRRNAVLIDDARLFIGENGYPTLDQLISYLRKETSLIITPKIENDIIFINS